jgi:hypothetical protein
MDTSPLPPERRHHDVIADRARRCCKCGGEMRCRALTEFRVNGGYSGREYTFVCQGCRQMVTEISAGRVAYAIGLVGLGGGLGGMLVFYGVKMLVDTIQHGPGGNDLSAVILVLVVFLGLGAPFLLLMLWAGKSFIADWLALRRNPVLR